MYKGTVYLKNIDDKIWSNYDERNSKEETIASGIEVAKEEGLEKLSLGRMIPCDTSFISVEDIIIRPQESLYDKVCEAADLCLDNLSEEQENELEEALNEELFEVFFRWRKKHNLFPNSYSIVDEEEITVLKE